MTEDEGEAVRSVLEAAMRAVQDAYRGRELREVMPEIIRELMAVASDTAKSAGLSSYQFRMLCERARQAEWPDNPPKEN